MSDGDQWTDRYIGCPYLEETGIVVVGMQRRGTLMLPLASMCTTEACVVKSL